MSLNYINFDEYPIDMNALNAAADGMCIFSNFELIFLVLRKLKLSGNLIL